MTKRTLRSFCTEDRAAISPLYAVGILALVAVSGVGFDYGRLMALDSELQNAADQAALAAATQLDGGEDAMTRARDAARNTLATAGSAFVNETRFSNDRSGAGRTVAIDDEGFKFYDDYADDSLGAVVPYSDTEGADAKVVEVTVNARQVFYALTPLVGALNSGPVIGKALAALETGTCNVPPMMFCVPEVGGVADPNFPTAADVGKGLKLHFKTNGPDSPGGPNTVDDTIWAPGNFGFLDIDYLPNGQGQNQTTGLNAYILGCTATPVESEPGFRTPQGAALNTRFDFYPNPSPNCDESTGDFCPAENTRKNLVLEMKDSATSCLPAPNNIQPKDWKDPASVGISAASDPGYPQDACFSGSCTVIGDGNWNGAAWVTDHHGVDISTIPDVDGNGSISRYETYLWELGDPASRLMPQMFTGSDGKKYCSYPQPVTETAVPSSDTQKDRRILTVAAVDCTELNGRAPVKIVKWVDMFLVQTVATTQNDRNFFSEIVSPARQANGDSGFQYFGRKKAVLIR